MALPATLNLGLYSNFMKDFRPIPPLRQSDVEVKLREEETSIVPPKDFGVSHYDIVRVPSNFPVEDDLIHGTLAIPGNEAVRDRTAIFWGIFDGHEGWEMSTKLRSSLMDYVSHELNMVYQASPVEPTQEAITKAIEAAFENLDNDVIESGEAAVKSSLPLADALSCLTVAYAGSCALLGIYDPTSCLLRVACVGDSRAVLGRRKKDGTWETIALSADQNMQNGSEVTRLQQEHPDEPDMIDDDTVLGMYITRAFGDGRWKYSTEVQQKMKDNFFARRPLPGSLTPPYLTAKPVVSLTEVQPGKDFVILASDGMWNHMKSEEAVILVGKWLEDKAKGETQMKEIPQESTILQQALSELSMQPQAVPLEVHPESIIVLDDNAATHLARHALGGADKELLRGKLTLRAPFARRVRDDITVQVVFFGI